MYWFLPVIVVQWLFGFDILAPRLPVILIATLVIGTLLSVADVWAVRKGIWYFDEAQITRVYVAGILPWEEVAFFYTTSLLVSQSILVLAPSSLR
jgi:lycopene cyclase domain-containing protein